MTRIIKEIIVHCSDTTGGSAAAIRKFHMAPPPAGRGWNDIGYHYVIDLDGTIEPGRKEDMVGAHCEDHNADSLGICLIGVDQFTTAQYESLKHLVISIMNHHGLTLDAVHCHYEFDTAIKQGKTCPNIKVEDVHKLIQEAIT